MAFIYWLISSIFENIFTFLYVYDHVIYVFIKKIRFIRQVLMWYLLLYD